MRKSYIANSAEALNLHNGTQSAIVVKMKVQPKGSDVIERNGKITVFEPDNVFPLIGCYRIGQEVYVRESWMNVYDSIKKKTIPEAKTGGTFEHFSGARWNSAATMPKSAARTRFKIVSCEAVRVLSLQPSHLLSVLKGEYKELINYTLDKPHINLYDYIEDYIISRFGQSAWDNNHFIWYYKIEKI
jgi:hypothetical protein